MATLAADDDDGEAEAEATPLPGDNASKRLANDLTDVGSASDSL